LHLIGFQLILSIVIPTPKNDERALSDRADRSCAPAEVNAPVAGKVPARVGLWVSQEVQIFCCVLLLQILLPLIPLGLEYWINETVQQKNVVLAAAIYVISVGLSSRNIVMLGAGIFASIIFSALYGVMLKADTPPFGAGWIAFGTIQLAVVIHGFERYNRHVVEGETFLPTIQ